MTRNDVAGVFLILAMLMTGVAHGQAGSPEIAFSATREGDFLLVDARADLPVSPVLAWGVLADYESYPRFISSMRESKLVSRLPEGLIIDQKGSFGFLFFTKMIEVRMLVSEFPPNVIVSRSFGGSFRDVFGRYELQPLDAGVRVIYTGRLLPDFCLPPLIGVSIVEYVLQRNFSEMIDEILRRNAAAVQAGKAG